ncbi:MAG: SDR family oxidoreductase [Chloroflexota bacterium]
MSDQKQVAIVTAAGKGMGAAIARKLAANNYDVALMSPSGRSVELAEELGGIGMAGSVTAVSDLERLVEATLSRFGRIDAVVNHTGHPPKGDLLAIPDEDWHKGLDLVMLNVVRMARLATPTMIEQGGGSIVNISTYAVFEPEALFPVSAALRAALAGFTKLFADRYAKDNVRMNNILPGFIDSLPETADRRERIPMGRYGTVEEIANAVRFLVSSESSYITGQNLRVDGGITRSV